LKPILEFLSRPGCHLCDDALPIVWRAARLTGTGVREVDITLDDEMAVDWGVRIPVVRWPDGAVLAEGRVALGPLILAVARRRLRPR
jgi:hypothetical protein